MLHTDAAQVFAEVSMDFIGDLGEANIATPIDHNIGPLKGVAGLYV